MDELKQNEIIRSCQAGQPEDFGQLYEVYVKRIYDFVYFRVFHKETAEDLTSQTFFKALEGVGKFRPEKGSFSAWLYRIARNTVIDHYRTSKAGLSLEEVWGIGNQEDLPKDIEVKEQLARVREILAKVKKEHREIMIMRLWDDLPFRQIAEVTGKSEGACKMIFSRTAKLLRNELLILLIFKTIIKIYA